MIEYSSTLERLFAETAGQYADEIAVSQGAGRLTYRALNRWANQTAFALFPYIENNQAPVALLFGHDTVGIAAALGVLKAGRPYSYLAEHSPQQEQAFILRDLGCRVLLTDNDHEQQAAKISSGLRITIVNLEQLPNELPAYDPPSSSRPDDLACIYYTSGATGHPKGVMRTHKTVLGRLQVDRSIYQVGSRDNLAFLSKFNFGAACATIYNGLLNGATLHLADPKQMGASNLANWLVENRITSLRAATTLLRQILDAVPQHFCFDDMLYCRPSGRLLGNDVERLWRHLPNGCLFGHGLASTESSLVTHYLMERGELLPAEVMPVGTPVNGVEIALLDPAGQPVGAGEIGEIVVSSMNVTPGYWRNEELSALKIKQDPKMSDHRIIATGDLGRWRPDKMLEYIGRKDNQVKVRGYRIELEAVEAALEQLPGVGQAAVRAFADGRGDLQLVGYVEPEMEKTVSTAELRRQLSERVPDYMVPARVVEMQELPLVRTGKVDRAALPDPARFRPELDVAYAAPRTSTEIRLAEIWSDLLAVDEIGVDDTFFDLGGQSLLAAAVASRANAEFQIDLPMKTLFEAATIATLAEKIDLLADDSDQLSDTDLAAKLGLLGF